MDIFKGLFYISLSALSLFYIIARKCLAHWRERGILHAKPNFLWGNLKGVGNKRHISHALEEVYEQFKGTQSPFVGFYAFLRPMVMVLRLDTIQHILETDFQNFPDRGLYSNMRFDPLAANAVQLDGKNWRNLRSKLNDDFQEKRILALFPQLLRIAKRFDNSIRLQYQSSARSCNITDLVANYNLNVIASLAFGVENSSVELSNQLTDFQAQCNTYNSNQSLLKEYLAVCFPNLAKWFGYCSYTSSSSCYFLKLVSHKLQQSSTSLPKDGECRDFLQLFGRHKHLSDRKIAAQCFSFVLAGLKASNATLLFSLYELALQQEIQVRARSEILQVLSKYDGDICSDSLKEMRYLKQIFRETLRKYPPYAFLLRKTNADYEVPNSVFLLKKGNSIIIPVSAIHHDADIYPNPLKFDPDRFQGYERLKRHRMAWLPFGAGERHCVATEFVQMQVLLGLVVLLRSYKLSACAETSIPLRYDNNGLVLRPEEDIKLILDLI